MDFASQRIEIWANSSFLGFVEQIKLPKGAGAGKKIRSVSVYSRVISMQVMLFVIVIFHLHSSRPTFELISGPLDCLSSYYHNTYARFLRFHLTYLGL